MVRWHWFALVCLLLLPSLSAQATPFLRFDGLNIYFGSQSYLSVFSCVDGTCHPGFGSITPAEQHYYSSMGFPIEDRYVELKVNYSLDSAPPCALKLASSQLFTVSAGTQPASAGSSPKMRFSSGNDSYGLELADNQSVSVTIEANGTQLCITPNAPAGFMHLYLIPLANESSPGPAQTQQPSEAVSSANSSNGWVSLPEVYFTSGSVLSAATRPPQPPQTSQQPAFPGLLTAIPVLVVLALMLLFLLRGPKSKKWGKIIMPDLS